MRNATFVRLALFGQSIAKPGPIKAIGTHSA
jgi:hypothetical protein